LLALQKQHDETEKQNITIRVIYLRGTSGTGAEGAGLGTVAVTFLLPRVRFPFTSVNAMSAADRAGGRLPTSDARRVLRRTAVRAACSSAAASTSSTDMGTGTAGAEDDASSKMANDDDDDAGGAGGATAGKSTAPPLSSTMSASARPRTASSAMWVATMPCSSVHCGSRVASPRFVVARPFVGAGFGAANDALFSIPVRGIRAAVDAIVRPPV